MLCQFKQELREKITPKTPIKMAMCDNRKRALINSTCVESKDVQELLNHFSKQQYQANYEDTFCNTTMQKCIDLFKVNYDVTVLSNANGELTTHYPSQLVLIENINGNGNLNRTTDTIYEQTFDVQQLYELMNKARFARCRTRFPMPVIFYKGKYVCRSATLSGGAEIYGRSGLDFFFYTAGVDMARSSRPSTSQEQPTDAPQQPPSPSEWQLFNRVRNQDIHLLKALNVGTIVDLMVEKKKVKFGLNVTSSEKVDKENRYADFDILSLPYPGCEFFKDFREHNYVGKDLHFNWAQPYIDADIFIPDNAISYQLNINWTNYKNWDLIQMTQKYFLLILKYLQDNPKGILIHCISGWDRTPLFISILRLSLWADGLAHQSLDAYQILYLTLAYDWMLFGHHLRDRLDKGEEILFFCFYILKYLVGDEYSINPANGRHKLKKAEVSPDKTDVCEKNVLQPDIDIQTDDFPALEENNSDETVDDEDETESFVELTAHPLTSFPTTKRTSPVNVPALQCPKEDNYSSLSNSWQMITGTGSLKSDTSSTLESNGTNGRGSEDPHLTNGDDENVEINTSEKKRKIKLLSVRHLFYSCYSSTIGLKFKDGTDSSTIGSVIGTIADKVCFSQKM